MADRCLILNMANGKETKGNGMTALLQMASSGDNWVKLATLGLVALSGGVNFITTNTNADATRANAVHQVQVVYDKVNEAEARQLQYMRSLAEIADSNAKQLENQTKMLENQQAFLKILREEREIDINRILNDVDEIKKRLPESHQ